MILGLDGPYRVPDLLREADQACRAHSRGEEGESWIDLGELAEVKASFMD